MIPEAFQAYEDLTNGWYPQYPPISGKDPLLADQLDFLSEHKTPDPEFVQPKFMAFHGLGHAIRAGIPTTDEDGQFPAPVLLIFQNNNAALVVDVADLYHRTNPIIIGINGALGLDIPPYPGFDLRHPKKPSPVGDIWRKHPNFKAKDPVKGGGYEYYRPSKTFDPSDFTVGGVERGSLHEELRGGAWMRFELVQTLKGFAWLDVSEVGARA